MLRPLLVGQSSPHYLGARRPGFIRCGCGHGASCSSVSKYPHRFKVVTEITT